MSLSDSLLFDEYSQPNEVWIANRGPTGPRGSGTQADPWNAATIPHPAITIQALKKGNASLGENPGEARVTANNHGFKSDDMITISGLATRDANGENGDYFYLEAIS